MPEFGRHPPPASLSLANSEVIKDRDGQDTPFIAGSVWLKCPGEDGCSDDVANGISPVEQITRLFSASLADEDDDEARAGREYCLAVTDEIERTKLAVDAIRAILADHEAYDSEDAPHIVWVVPQEDLARDVKNLIHYFDKVSVFACYTPSQRVQTWQPYRWIGLAQSHLTSSLCLRFVAGASYRDHGSEFGRERRRR